MKNARKVRNIPKISIIVPCYNVADYLYRCLNALLAQTFTDWQAVCVDDGSTDETYEILKKYAQKDKRIIAIHQENHGVEWARANAMEHIKSPYVMFCDPDDWYESQMCQKMLTTLERENADIVMCQVFLDGEKDWEMEKYFSHYPVGVYANPFQFLNMGGLILGRCLFKTQIIQKSHLIFPKDCHVRRGYDTFFITQYLMITNKIVFCSDYLYHYWQRSDSLVHQYNTGKSVCKMDVFYNFTYLVEFMKKNKLYSKVKEKIFLWMNRRACIAVCKIPDDQKLQALKEVSSLYKNMKGDIPRKCRFLYKIVHQKYPWMLRRTSSTLPISLFGIKLAELKRERKNRTFNIFGYCVFRKERKDGRKKIYLCKLCVYKRRKK